MENIGEVGYEYEGPSGGGSGTGMRLSKDGYLNSGVGGGHGAFMKEGAYTMTIYWNGKNETFEVKSG